MLVLGRLTMTRAEYQEQRRRLEEVSLTSVPQARITRGCGCGVRLIVFVVSTLR